MSLESSASWVAPIVIAAMGIHCDNHESRLFSSCLEIGFLLVAFAFYVYRVHDLIS